MKIEKINEAYKLGKYCYLTLEEAQREALRSIFRQLEGTVSSSNYVELVMKNKEDIITILNSK